MPTYDPKDVHIVERRERGESVYVTGVANGRKVDVEIPKPSLQRFKTEAEARAFIKRSVLGASREVS